MATLKIMMIGGRRCGKTTILSKIKQHFNEVLHHGPTEGEPNDLLRLNPPVGAITELNDAQSCINQLFFAIGRFDKFPIDENPSQDMTIIKFSLDPLRGKGSITLEFTDIPGEWCSYIDGISKGNHIGEVVNLIKESNVIIMAIDTPSLFEEGGMYADYYNRIHDINEIFSTAFSGETFSKAESQKMILFVPMKCEKYIVNAKGNVNIEKQGEICDKVKKKYAEMIKQFSQYPNNVTMAILPIITIKEVEWDSFYTLNRTTKETGSIYGKDGQPQNFIYGKSDPIQVNSYFRFKPELYDDIADGNKESQSLYCEQPLVYSLVFLFKYYSKYGINMKLLGSLSKIPIIGSFLNALNNLFNIFTENKVYEQESKRLQSKIMLKGKSGFQILQNPLNI